MCMVDITASMKMQINGIATCQGQYFIIYSWDLMLCQYYESFA